MLQRKHQRGGGGGAAGAGAAGSGNADPASAGAALKALEILEAEPGRAARPLALARRFTAAVGLQEAESAIVPLIVGEAERALKLSAALEDEA